LQTLPLPTSSKPNDRVSHHPLHIHEMFEFSFVRLHEQLFEIVASWISWIWKLADDLLLLQRVKRV